MPRAWLNIDLGESPDEPDELYALAHIANIACGGHAGDDASMQRAVMLCTRNGTKIGAHPSYPDRAHFGRVRMSLDAEALEATVAEQCDRLVDIANAAGAKVDFAKLHGALYHDAASDPVVARAAVAGIVESLGYEIAVLGPPHGALAAACEHAGVPLLVEGFADRGIRADGSLVPRGEPGALISDPAHAAAVAAARVREGACRTICVHGDTPGAVAIARAVRAALDALADRA